LKSMVDCPNVNVKLSGLGTFVHACREDLMKFIVTETVALFGADRCLFGSNFPIEKPDALSKLSDMRSPISPIVNRRQSCTIPRPVCTGLAKA
jgi:predicted TIM-barrel fold metal-dependent hydrolase